MGKATPQSVRASILRAFAEKKSYRQIAAMYKVNEQTVRQICRRSLDSEESALKPHYVSCGRKGTGPNDFVYRASCFLKYYHRSWGADYILVQLRGKYPGLSLPSGRTLQRWFRARGWNPKRHRSMSISRRWAKRPHEVWQIDAKERIGLKAEARAECCWLSITDEHSGSAIATPAFSPRAHSSGSSCADSTCFAESF